MFQSTSKFYSAIVCYFASTNIVNTFFGIVLLLLLQHQEQIRVLWILFKIEILDV